MVKIVIDARESGTSTGRYIDKLVENLHALKTDDEFVILTKKHRLEAINKMAPNFEVVESNYKEFTFSEQFRFVWQLYGIKNDLVHFGMTQQPILYFGNCITTIHDLTTARFTNPARNRAVFKFKQMVYKLVIKRVAKKSKLIITASQYVKDDIVSFTGVAPSKIKVIYEAADKITDKSVPISQLLSTSYLLYVGRPQPHKNLWRLVEAYDIARRSYPDLKLVLAGKHDVLYEKLKQKVAKKGIKGVVFTGFVSEGQLRWLYENCAGYVFPSLSEGFGLPGLEAMVHGAPVISSNATCLPEIYGQAAHYFDPLDTDDMASKISEILDNEKMRKTLVEKGYKQASKYSWAKMAKETELVYKQALKN